MNKIVILVILFSVSLAAFAQDGLSSLDYIEMPDSTVFSSGKSTELPRKLKTNVNLDMSYSFSNKGYFGSGYRISPYFSYPLNERISIIGGASIGFYNMNMPISSGENNSQMLPMTRMYLFAGGSYKVNEKLLITGMAYKQIIDVPNREQTGYSSLNTDYNGISVGFNYSLAPGFTIGAQFRTNSGYPSYNPYMAGGYTPFGSPVW